MKGNVEKARLSLKYFRKPVDCVDQELNTMQSALAKVHYHIYKFTHFNNYLVLE